MKENLPRIANFNLNGCYIRLGIDMRHIDRAPDHKTPISIIFQVGSNWRHYVPLQYRVTVDQYKKIARSTGQGRPAAGEEQRPFDIKSDIIKSINLAYEHLKKFVGNDDRPLTKERVLDFLNGVKQDDYSFTDLWKEVADQIKVKDEKKSTGPSYDTARKSFIRLVGEIKGFNISIQEVRAWEEAMKAEPLSSTTIGIYERAMRVVWNEAQRRGLIDKELYPFGKGLGKIHIPTGGSRRHHYLDVQKMSELYRIFVDNDYPKTIQNSSKEAVHKHLGLFLLLYLCNGCYMSDLAGIRYNSLFLQPPGEQMLFFRRKKTEDRDAISSEVYIPVIPELATILNRTAAPFVDGELVFPQIYNGIKDDDGQRKRVNQVNKDIRKYLRILTKSLGWPELLGDSWARHSFSTNLSHAGISEEYRQEAMGQANRTAPVTNLYTEKYPVAVRMKNNSFLLRPAPEPGTFVESLTQEELELIKKFRTEKEKSKL